MFQQGIIWNTWAWSKHDGKKGGRVALVFVKVGDLDFSCNVIKAAFHKMFSIILSELGKHTK